MRRKILCMILTGIICVLLITGCSPQGGDNSVSGTDTTKIEEQKEPSDLKLPSDARILIRTGEGSDEFTKLYTARLKGYLLAAGVPEENIINVDKAVEELAQNAKDLLKDCTVLIVGNAEPEEVSLITKQDGDPGSLFWHGSGRDTKSAVGEAELESLMGEGGLLESGREKSS